MISIVIINLKIIIIVKLKVKIIIIKNKYKIVLINNSNLKFPQINIIKVSHHIKNVIKIV